MNRPQRALPNLLGPLFALLIAPACSIATVPLDGQRSVAVGFLALAADCAGHDVVFFGELHNSDKCHQQQLALLGALHADRPDIIVTMEMFERDVQQHLDAYLRGELPEAEFRKLARAWKNWHHYRPVVDFAKAHGLPVIAANAPDALVKKVSRGGGLAAVQGEAHVAEAVSAPDDAYFEAFKKMMAGHGSMSPDKIEFFYQAQCLRDDTMAETIANQLGAAHAAGRRPLVFHLCGAMHSDRRRGTVQRLLQRMPDLAVRVITTKSDAVAWFRTTSGDFVLLAPAKAKRLKKAKKDADKKDADKKDADKKDADKKDQKGTESDAEKKAESGIAQGGAAENAATPGLGFKPLYDIGDQHGVGVDFPIPGGAAAKAGVKAGDIIQRLAGEELQDIRHYMEVLSEQKIGTKVKIVVLRNKKPVELEVVIGVSGR